jgi:2-(3-amino-3-carboxypropyl)histidine synthase
MDSDLWDFDEEAVFAAVDKHGAKKVLLQFPDGIKPFANELARKVFERTGAEVLVWAGSNFGACDLPVEARSVGVDLVIHFGHTPWNYKREVVQ